MKFTELVEGIKTSFKNGESDQATLLSALGLKAVTEEEHSLIAKAKDAEQKVGKPIDEFVESVLEERKSTFSTIRDAKLKAAFEQEKVLAIAKDMFRLDAGNAEEIDAEITRLKGLDSIKTYQTDLASKVGHSMSAEANLEGQSTKNDTTVVEV